MIQHGWSPDQKLLSGEYRSLFMKVQSLVGPDELTVGMLRYITNNTLINSNEVSPCGAIKKILPWDEEYFLLQRHNDHVTIMSKMPKTSRGMGLPWQKAGPRKTNLSHDGEHYSNLILFGPTAFPILITSKNYVAAAGARYGKGRLVVLPHEAVLHMMD